MTYDQAVSRTTNNPLGRAAPGTTSQPYRTTPEEAREHASLPVWSATEPNAAGLFHPPLGRDWAYRLAQRGELPGAVKLGTRYRVGTAPLLAALGVS